MTHLIYVLFRGMLYNFQIFGDFLDVLLLLIAIVNLLFFFFTNHTLYDWFLKKFLELFCG